MAEERETPERKDAGSSTRRMVGGAAMLVGAAGLFLFIVGLKRRHRLDDEREIDLRPEPGSTHSWTDATARHPVDDEAEREEA